MVFAVGGSITDGNQSAPAVVAPKTQSTVNRTPLEKKLEEYNRLQEAVKQVTLLNAQDEGNSSAFNMEEATTAAKTLGDGVDGVVSDIEKIEAARDQNDGRYQLILSQVKKVVDDIKLTKKAVLQSVTHITMYSQRMVETLALMEETKSYINNSQDTLMQLLPTLYMMQNEYTSQAWEVDDLKLLLSSDGSIGETLSYDDTLQGLGIRLDWLLDELIPAQKKYATQFTTLHETRKKLKENVLLYRSKIRTLQEQKAYLLGFMELYRGNKISLDKTIENLFETRAQLQNRVHIMIGDLYANHSAKLLSHPSYAELQKLNDTREQRSNALGWSILPVTAIRTSFGDTVRLGETEEVFNGLVAEAQQGDPIYAPADGFVYYLQDKDGVATNAMIIVHKNGYITTFANIMESLVKTNDIIKRGQIIARVGWQPGTRGAWWFSYAPSLSMQVFRNSIPVDPLQLLDLSVIQNPTILKKEYQAKYDIDTRARNTNIDFSNVVFMEWETLHERRLNFLDKVAAWPYRDLTLWESAAAGTNVDVDLGMCIGYAETSMGRAFASANNIGNVGNNDRGDRVDKASPEAGARAIYVTLNNQYLGGYHTIYELSGYGNKDGAIYASSEYNRQKNVSRCLSVIKWYIVPEDYPFRTLEKN
jgi:murein DD-endopeptidase MepM/ murein hydrolase activator NlpD